MKTLAELTSTNEPALPLLQSWIAAAAVTCEVLSPSASRGDELLSLQITTRSPMGAVAFETGGLLLDDGWLRILGSGHPKITRSLQKWNDRKGKGFLLVADDAVGGFFAINGGALGSDTGSLYYFAPDSLRWEAMKFSYSQFIVWAFSARLVPFYKNLRWASWRESTRELHGDKCFFFYPPFWTREGSVHADQRRVVPIEEIWGSQLDFQRQLDSD